jgi:hypothetical protein
MWKNTTTKPNQKRSMGKWFKKLIKGKWNNFWF